MKCKIDFQNIEATDSDKEYVNKKIIAEVANFYDDPSTAVDVVLRDINGPKGGIDKEINVVITIAGEKNPIKITDTAVEINEVVDLAQDRINKVLRRLKDKNLDRIRRN